jgi:RNA polymerase sigma-70 factor (ECF subfamily)
MARPTSELPTRASLLLRLRDPLDLVSWRLFVDVYGPLAYRHCRRRGLGHEDAEDVTQEVFRRVAESIRTFEYRPEVGRFRDWLGTVVRNEINRFLKKKYATAGHEGAMTRDLNDLEGRGEDSSWEAEFNAHILQAALARSRPHFDPETWRAFELVWVENRPAAEVAREVGRAIDWVYVCKSRVLKRLWQEVRELAEDTVLLARPSSPNRISPP